MEIDGNATGTRINQTSNLKLIRSVNLSLEVENELQLKPAVDSLMTQACSAGGYTSYNSVNSYETRASAELELRIPKNQVDTFLDEVNGMYKVTSISDQSEDVTDQYIDVESRLKVKETARDKYMSYLERAESVEEVLEIEDRLNQTIEDIESSKSKLKSLDSRIDYTQVSISIRCENISYEKSYFEKAGEALKDIFESCGETLIEGFGWLLHSLICCLYAFPILFIVIRFIIFACGRKPKTKGLFKKKEKLEKKENPQSNEKKE